MNNINAIDGNRLAVLVHHLIVEACGFRITLHRSNRTDFGMPVHIGLTGKDVNLERLALSLHGHRTGEQYDKSGF